MIYHALYFLNTEQDVRSSSLYFSSTAVNGTAHVVHGNGSTVPFHVHVLVDVDRNGSYSKDIFNIPGYRPHSVVAVRDLYETFFYLSGEGNRTPLYCYGSLANKYKDYLRESGHNK